MPDMHTAPVNDTDGSLATCFNIAAWGMGWEVPGWCFFMSVAIFWMVELIARGY